MHGSQADRHLCLVSARSLPASHASSWPNSITSRLSPSQRRSARSGARLSSICLATISVIFTADTMLVVKSPCTWSPLGSLNKKGQHGGTVEYSHFLPHIARSLAKKSSATLSPGFLSFDTSPWIRFKYLLIRNQVQDTVLRIGQDVVAGLVLISSRVAAGITTRPPSPTRRRSKRGGCAATPP